MFTGLIEEIGVIKSIRQFGNARLLTIQANKIMDDLKIDDSVALNGVCQTVINLNDQTFEVEAVEETLRKTTLGKFKIGQNINLERAVRPNDRLGGHLVQGHVDCTGYVLSIIPETVGKNLWVSFPSKFRKYVVPIGSICIDGVSLTVAKVDTNKLMVTIIPHTWNSTILKELKNGKEVNLEFDIIGKYIENMVNPHLSENNIINPDYFI